MKLRELFTSRKNNLLPAIKFGGGSVMLWAVWLAQVLEKVVNVKGRMASTQYQQILGNNV